MKIKAIYLYLGFACWIILLAILLNYFHLNVTGLGVTLAFLTMIFMPGIFLWRILKFDVENMSAKILYIIGLGFCFYFLIGLIGIVFSLTLNVLIVMVILLNLGLFVWAFFYDWNEIFEVNLKQWFKNRTIADYVLMIIVILGTLLAFLSINAQTSNVQGDALFHFSILQKVMTANDLNPYNLWITKTTGLNLVYAFPIWHIVVALLASLTQINGYTAYVQVILPLVILTMVIFWALPRVLVNNRYLATFMYFGFLIYSFSAGSFYNLLFLRSPDSLNRLLLLPLLIGITVCYLFKKNDKLTKHIILLVLLAVFVGLIHFTQLVDYVFILVIFSIIYLVFAREKEVLKRVGYFVLVLVSSISFYIGFFHLNAFKNFILSNSHAQKDDTFVNKNYLDSNIFTLYTILLLPILALFYKKHRRLIFFTAIPLALVMISWQFFQLRGFYLKYLGDIFTTRAISDIPNFLYFGFFLYLICWFVNSLISRLNKKFIYAVDSLLVVVFLIVTFSPIMLIQNNFIDQVIIRGKSYFMHNIFVEALIVVWAISIIVYFVTRYLKTDIVLSPPKNLFNFSLISVVLLVSFSLPYFGEYTQKINQSSNKSIVSNREQKYVGDLPRIGGAKTADFINTLPSGVFIISNVNVAQNILPYGNLYAQEYPFGKSNFKDADLFYDQATDLSGKLEMVKDYKIDYVIALRSRETQQFDAYPEYFIKIFENKYTYVVQSKQGAYDKDGEFAVYKITGSLK